MTMFDHAVTSYMTRDVQTAGPATPLADIVQMLQSRRITSVPIVGPGGALLGLVSRTDLIHHGLGRLASPDGAANLAIPPGTARDIMSSSPVTLTPDRSLRDAARAMVEHSIHRVLVTEADHLVGVISTLDLARAIHGARIQAPVTAWMTSPAVTIDADRSIAEAVELLDSRHVTAVVVTEDGWPVGMFSQLEALAARDLPPTTPVSTVIDSAIICVPSTLRVYRAAAQAARLDVRRVVVTMAGELVGVISGLDLARIVAE